MQQSTWNWTLLDADTTYIFKYSAYQLIHKCKTEKYIKNSVWGKEKTSVLNKNSKTKNSKQLNDPAMNTI